MTMIFPSLNASLAGPLLSTLGLATLFVCMMLVSNSILQSYGFVNLPVFIMLIGGIAKIIINYNVVILPSVGIYGAPIGNIVCFALCLVLCLLVIARVIPHRPAYFSMFIKPVAASLVMGLAVWAVYGLVGKGYSALCSTIGASPSHLGMILATMSSILVGVIIYGVLVILFHAITKEDLMLMPKGEKIARILHLS